MLTSRALIVGPHLRLRLGKLVTRFSRGLRIFSVRQYTLGLADKISSVNPNVFTARLNGIEAAFLMVIVATIATIYGVRRLQRWEIGEST